MYEGGRIRLLGSRSIGEAWRGELLRASRGSERRDEGVGPLRGVLGPLSGFYHRKRGTTGGHLNFFPPSVFLLSESVNLLVSTGSIGRPSGT